MKLDKTALDIIRARKCMTVKELAATAKVSAATISSTGTKSIEPISAGRIAAALGVDVTEIIVTEE